LILTHLSFNTDKIQPAAKSTIHCGNFLMFFKVSIKSIAVLGISATALTATLPTAFPIVVIHSVTVVGSVPKSVSSLSQYGTLSLLVSEL
jgi:hypothetical protein